MPFDLTHVPIAEFLDKTETIRLVMIAAIPPVIAVGIFYLVVFLDHRVNQKLRWLSMVPLLIGLLMAWTPLMQIMDAAYVQLNDLSERGKLMHYAAFAVQIVTAGLLVLWNWLLNRHKSQSDFLID